MPRSTRARPASRDRRLYGHRGASSELPENTLEAFARALERGANALETDAHLTADGHLVLAHDDDGWRMAAVARPIRSCPLSEIRRWDAGYGLIDARGERPHAGKGLRVPTLHEFFDAFPGVRVNIDVKQRTPPMIEPLLNLLRDRGVEEHVTLASFYPDVLREVRARGFRGETGLSRAEVLRLALIPGVLRRGPLRVAGDAVQIPARTALPDLTSRAFIARCHAAGLRVDYWVIDDPIDAAVLLHRGADGIMTDDPAAIAPIIAR